MILLDTNVISELMRASPDPGVVRWMRARSRASIHTSAITEAELRLGAALLPHGRRRAALQEGIERIITQLIAGRILPFDSAAAAQFASVVSQRRLAGRPIAQADAQIAAIARARAMTLATRNLRDFAATGVTLVDPWAA